MNTFTGHRQPHESYSRNHRFTRITNHSQPLESRARTHEHEQKYHKNELASAPASAPPAGRPPCQAPRRPPCQDGLAPRQPPHLQDQVEV
jgi:hypothetical protein